MKDDYVHIENKLAYNYFIFDSVLPASADRYDLFCKLSEQFLLTTDKELFDLCNSPEVREITTEEMFFLRERIKKLGALTSGKYFEDKHGDLIAIKGQALSDARKWGLSKAQSTSETEKIESVVSMAKAGEVPAMYIYGFMLCNGIGVAQELRSGTEYIKKAAQWNYPEAILFMLCGGTDRQKYLDLLSTVTVDTPYKPLVALAERKYALKAHSNAVSKLTDDLTKRGVIAAAQYNFQMARVLRSDILSLHAKQKIAYSEDKGLISAAATLPCEFDDWKFIGVDYEKLPIAKCKESRELSFALTNQAFCAQQNYLPICLCCDDSYVLDYYAQRIREDYPQVNFVSIDLAEVKPSDLHRDKDSVFLRGLQEERVNVVMINCYGDVEKDAMSEMCKFLQSAKRKAYALEYGYSVDVSGVVPMCFCDRASLVKLQKHCTVFDLPVLTKQEKRIAVDDALAATKKAYNVTALEFESGALDMLTALNAATAVKTVERIVQNSRGGKSTVVTKQIMQKYIGNAEKSVTTIGFGRIE